MSPDPDPEVDLGPDPRPGRLSRRRALAAGGAVTVLLIGGGVALAGRQGDKSDHDTATTAPSRLETAKVEKRTLEEHTSLDGTIGYGDETKVGGGQGKITALPAIGSIVSRGQTLVEVDARPVPLLYGDRPFWRDLAPGMTDGVDVKELETNLVALGIVTTSRLTVDGKWTDATTRAVKAWQKKLGLDQTGTVPTSSVVVQPGAVRVSSHPTPVGGPAGEQAVGVTGTEHVVTIDLEATKQRLVKPGQKVGVVLPDGKQLKGTIGSVGSVATAGATDPQTGEKGTPTIKVVVHLDDPAKSGRLDQAPVTVNVVTSAATGVLAVPVEALLALAQGGYAVQTVDATGRTHYVPVQLGAFANGWVQVTGKVTEGQRVVIPGA